MSLYNMINGVKPSTFFILPMLGKHPEEYPRFRDCFLSDPERPEYDNFIHIYTRVGGGNREDYEEEIEEMRSSQFFVDDFDDDFDSTYATYVFKIPEQWSADFNLIREGKLQETSKEYKEMIIKTFPKIEDKLKELLALS